MDVQAYGMALFRSRMNSQLVSDIELVSAIKSSSDMTFGRVTDNTLATQFPDLYTCARDHLAKAGDYMEVNDGQVLWIPIFRRNMIESKEAHLFNLFDILNGLQISEGASNNRVWSLSKDGHLSESSSLPDCITQALLILGPSCGRSCGRSRHNQEF